MNRGPTEPRPVQLAPPRFESAPTFPLCKALLGLFASAILIGCSPTIPERQTDSGAAAEWQEELARRQAAIERTRESGQRTQQTPAATRESGQRTQQTPAATTPAPVQTPPSDWRMINFVNEFGERTDQGAVTTEVSSRRPMSFPYGDTKARIFVDCDRAWVRFSESPNLTGGDTRDGYTRYSLLVRIDGNDARWQVNQSWGDNDLRFVDSSRAISALSGGSTFDLAVPWYGEGSVAFSWSLAGSSDAIRRSCD